VLFRARCALVALSLAGGCTFNVAKSPKEAQLFQQQSELYQWLYKQGFYRAQPELMHEVLRRMYGVKAKDQPADDKDEDEPTKRLLERLEKEVEELAKSRR
jgi:hypothetical protein